MDTMKEDLEMADVTYLTKVYHEIGGDRQVVASGGSLDVESGGEIDVESGGSLRIAGTALTGTAAELNKLAGVTAGAISASKAVVVGAANQVNEWTVTAGVLTQTKTVSSAALGTVRGVYGAVTGSNAAISGGNIVGVRGEVNLTGVISAGGAYLYGAQGKLLVTGEMNHADSRLCGVLAQLDISAGAYTAGQLSALWVDAGATSVAGALGGQFNMVRITNTTVSVPNAVILAYSEGSYLFDLGGPGGNADWFDAGTGVTGTCVGHLKVNLNGVPGWLRVYNSAS
jgi:hypothetical protein